MTRSSPVNPRVHEFIESLKHQFKPLWWPPFLFHYADIENIVHILQEGTLYCRNLAQAKGLLQVDSAGQDVISQTSAELLDYVRLYFRPRTPPLYHVEGFQPCGNVQSAFRAHCPIPVYLLFDAKKVLSSPGVRFSDGNLASRASDLFERTEDFHALDFSEIYHDTYLPNDDPEMKNRIKKRRCAEVIVPEKLQLEDSLSWIICRSVAERETLLNLLASRLYSQYAPITKVYSQCFFCNAHYVEKVVLQKSRIDLTFMPSGASFRYRYVFKTGGGTVQREYSSPQPAFIWESPQGNYSLDLFIDDHIAYKGHYEHMDVPF